MLRLIRWDKPIGSILLLGPTLAALWGASLINSTFHPLLWGLFVVGAITMRSVGCIINDIADRHWDGGVPRTADRPLVSGRVGLFHAFLLLVFLILVAFAVVLVTNWLTVFLAIPALLLALIYPYTKRWCGFPQWVLGCAYAWGVILAYSATLNRVPTESVGLFAATVFWMVATDTFYALADLPYDEKLGIQSFARWLGNRAENGIALCQGLMLSCLALWGYLSGTTPYFKWILAILALDCVYQQIKLRKIPPLEKEIQFSSSLLEKRNRLEQGEGVNKKNDIEKVLTERSTQLLALFKHNAYLSMGFFLLAIFGLS